MKKLLALVLCVMMFVAVIPTSAFAAGETTTTKAWADKAVSNTAIKEAEKSIKNMYTAIATDELVFGTAKSLYDLSNGLAENMFDGIASVDNASGTGKTYHDDLVKNTREYMNGIIGDSIANYISERKDVFKSDSINGNVDPEKYLKVFVAAVNDAVTSEKAQKGLQAFVYDLFALKTMSAVKGQAEDIQTAIKDWGTSKWGEFGTSFDPAIFVYDFDPVAGIANGDKDGWTVYWGQNYDNPVTEPWAFTTGSTGAYSGNSTANISAVWSTITK
jgi:hypothetical protein